MKSPYKSQNLLPGHRPPDSSQTFYLKVKPPPSNHTTQFRDIAAPDPESQTAPRPHTLGCGHLHRDLHPGHKRPKPPKNAHPRTRIQAHKASETFRPCGTESTQIKYPIPSQSLKRLRGSKCTQTAPGMSHPAIHIHPQRARHLILLGRRAKPAQTPLPGPQLHASVGLTVPRQTRQTRLVTELGLRYTEGAHVRTPPTPAHAASDPDSKPAIARNLATDRGDTVSPVRTLSR